MNSNAASGPQHPSSVPSPFSATSKQTPSPAPQPTSTSASTPSSVPGIPPAGNQTDNGNPAKKPGTTPKSGGGSTKKKPRRKNKNPGNNPNAPRGQNAVAAAANAALLRERATKELEGIRTHQRARREDAAWLSSEMVASAADYAVPEGENGDRSGFLEREGKIVDAALKANGMGRGDLTRQAFGCLMEHARRYACVLVSDAQDYAWQCSLHEVTGADLKLAAEMRDDFKCEGPPIDKLMSHAEEVNIIPLPPIPSNCYRGVVLPQTNLQLTARTFDVVSSKRMGVDEGAVANGKEKKEESTAAADVAGSYGAHKGRQIPVNILSDKGVETVVDATAPTTTTAAPTTATPPTTTAATPTDATVTDVSATTTTATPTATLAPVPPTAAITTGAEPMAVDNTAPPLEPTGTKRKADELAELTF